ncbi:hypothetical protein BDW74DRAFT_183370 [Aspergillus multicolor]|uniref:uncharacterized protein n=1 Tax=Aspergillus multicolor TaxID=41759 RepID=UPI003CCDA848
MASQKSEEILIWEDQEQDDYSQLLSNLQSNERHKTALLPAKRENETVSTTPNKHVKLDHLPQDHDEASPVDELISEGCPDLVPDDDEIIDGTPHEDEISELHDIPEAELEDLEVETEHVVCKSTLTVPAPSDETAHNVSQFQKRLRSVIKYLFHHAETVHWNDITKSTAWVGRSCYHPMRTACKHSVLSFIDSVIPLQTQAVLGDDHITPEKLRSLPPINPTADEVGVYGCYIRQVGRAGGLYIGSTAWSLSKRLKEHLYRMRLARQRGCTKGAFYKFYISRPDSIPYFFAIAAWPKAGSSAWLVRLIETIVMLILDTFAVSKASPTYTVGEEQLSDLKDKAGLRANEFVPLNSALPTKQTLKTALKRECVNCGLLSCSKCYQGMKLKSSSLGTVNRSEQDRQKGEMTYLEFREGKKKVNLHDLYAYLQRAHRIDRTRGAVEAAGGIARWYEANPMNRG